MEYRKINYISLIYHFYKFNYTLGMYEKFNNDFFFRKSKMNVFFPLFTSLNNLEGRPLSLKKRPFAFQYYSLFCREDLRETFLPFRSRFNKSVFQMFFKHANKNNFFLKKRTKKISLPGFFNSFFISNNKIADLFCKIATKITYFFFFMINLNSFFRIKFNCSVFYDFSLFLLKKNNINTNYSQFFFSSFSLQTRKKKIYMLLHYRKKMKMYTQKGNFFKKLHKKKEFEISILKECLLQRKESFFCKK